MPVPEIDVDELAHLRKGNVPLIDVREPHEYTEFHATGAVLLPLGQVVDRLDEVPRDETVYIICRSGARSAKAAEQLIANGIDAVNVAGGSLAWRSAGFPVVAGSDPG